MPQTGHGAKSSELGAMCSLPRLRGRVGERVSPQEDSPRGENPHPALCADLSRKRERLERARGQIT
ncbi:hypothetical protein ACVWWG_002544 [Bradyrhizobium sp. LB7.2]